ncbi:MAG: type II secretion system protein GspG [Proteobacteria bacterium]|nr:type II secretion system protein GspG [Pseudomonadota bacterium]
MLDDGWKNPFIFKIDGKDFIIKSLGADGKEGGAAYGRDIIFAIKERDYLAHFAGYISPHGVYYSVEEIERDKVINRDEKAFPDGEVTPVWVHIYYRPMATCPARDAGKVGVQECGIRFDIWRCMEEIENITVKKAEKDGYFCFDDVPIGTERLLAVTQRVMHRPDADCPWVEKDIMQPYKIDIEPGINWLGNMGVVP